VGDQQGGDMWIPHLPEAPVVTFFQKYFTIDQEWGMNTPSALRTPDAAHPKMDAACPGVGDSRLHGPGLPPSQFSPHS